jgi:type IV pilus secretin PilQ/predicted competence protein
MANLLKQVVFGAAVICGLNVAEAQDNAAASNATARPNPPTVVPTSGNIATTASNPHTTDSTIATTPSAHSSNDSSMVVVQAAQGTAPVAKPIASPAAAGETDPSITDNGGVGVREFQGDDVGQVLRLLARQAKINMVVSEAVAGTVTMRLEDVTALQAIGIIVKAKSLFMDKLDNVYYIKTAAERTAEPTESDSYQFSYSRAKDIAPLVASQLASKDAPQVDERTNVLFYRETRSNIDNIRKMLAQIDKPTRQVMIEARLVEVTANPKQSYGINWAGVFGGSGTPQTIRYSGTNLLRDSTGQLVPNNPTLGNENNHNLFESSLGNLASGQFAILTVPQMSITMRLLNEDSDAEFLANPRVVTADNQQAKIEISRAQPVPQLNFNEQTATAVFGGFQDKKFGNTLLVRPSVNKDNFVTLSVKPEISNKVGDATFIFAGATVASPIIDTRSLDSNVLIRSGDTLAIGGLVQDEVSKGRNKVPVLGDIPILGYVFQEHLNARTKRNLLVFVTPTILDQHYGTGLEDQVSGLHHSGEEYADPNGWRNNAKGAVRLVPTSQRQVAADYPKPGIPPAPNGSGNVRFMSTAKDRDF